MHTQSILKQKKTFFFIFCDMENYKINFCVSFSYPGVCFLAWIALCAIYDDDDDDDHDFGCSWL